MLSSEVDPPHRALLAAFGCTLALVLALLPAARAQTINPLDPSKMAVTQYKIDGWQTEQGLPQNTVQSMYQTRDGYLWVGTGGGLARFDGIRFTTFESSFVALVTLVTLAGAVSLFQLRTLQLRRRHAEMERLIATKTEELKVANEHLSRLSFADALTGLANRRRLDEVLETEWRRASRLQTPLAVVIADIDAFKAYNDARGHPEGDNALVQVADVIRDATSRAGDFAARYGGEEFMMLIPGADPSAARAFAESLRQACEDRAIPHPASPVATVVTISLGVASRVPVAGSSASGLVAEADAALYRAKQEGRNRAR